MRCTQCGTELPTSNARFCNNCGATISIQEQNVKPPSAPKSPPLPPASSLADGAKPPLREQTAIQPPARPSRNPASNEPPSWMSKLESGNRTRPAPHITRQSHAPEKPKVTQPEKSQEPAKTPETPLDQVKIDRPVKPVEPMQKTQLEEASEDKQLPSSFKPSEAQVSTEREKTPEVVEGDQKEQAIETLLDELKFTQSKKEIEAEVLQLDLQDDANQPDDKLPELPVKPQGSFSEPPPEPDIADKHTQFSIQSPEPIARSKSVRELRVKVWEQEETVAFQPTVEQEQVDLPVIEDTPTSPLKVNSSSETSIVEDAPTGPLMVSPPDLLIQRSSTPPPVTKSQSAEISEIEHIDTVHLSSQVQIKPVQQPAKEPDRPTWAAQGGTIERPLGARPPRPTPLPPTSMPPMTQPGNEVMQQPARPVVEPEWQTRQRVSPPYQQTEQAPARRYDGFTQSPSPVEEQKLPETHTATKAEPVRRSRNRTPLFVVLLLLIVLLAGIIGAWVVLVKPFSVPSVTQPYQSYQNADLGFSIDYPTGWKVQSDKSKMTAMLIDSTNTDQMNIVVAASTGTDLNQYLQQEATQLSMTSLKTATTLSFAGTTWQQLQGSVQVEGASYTETLLVTVHGSYQYTIMQLAPQKTYDDEESIIFSVMRSSMRFL